MKKRLLKMNKMRSAASSIAVAVVVLAAAGGCSYADLFDSDPYRGIVSFGFEVVSFTPCGGGESWWMTGSDELNELQQAYFDLVENHYEPAYARLKGEPTVRGEYGHLGAYQREFEVESVVELRLPKVGECGR